MFKLALLLLLWFTIDFISNGYYKINMIPTITGVIIENASYFISTPGKFQ